MYVNTNGIITDTSVDIPRIWRPTLRQRHSGYSINGANMNNCVSAAKYQDWNIHYIIRKKIHNYN